MIWIGTNNSSDEEEDYNEEEHGGDVDELDDTIGRIDSITNCQRLWKPGISSRHIH